ncbi:hypothetical protein T4B_14849 [Trichinella pseudospiralis]|uniref:Uncharacterized protein n=2 Tax=Trichinella pseudospiralis TaxID=6337 RepID=A0A0V1FAR9_TRIPS|nr:hypothetical protein T4A_336 [Trichinella pseudospiralis]KRY64732.1 hypothetical protein T4A_1686 [Trichinella pseudospiralis]KRY64915.1 hypothetical protein T4A_7080 [Trichinella pseudospiralis]KRY82833.1 hypothetical protein T4D_9979 [Trichinella pseudospiralis]KRZ22098.1 hypothetical protein T4B_14849 [Trichinella pseudospiralis]
MSLHCKLSCSQPWSLFSIDIENTFYIIYIKCINKNRRKNACQREQKKLREEESEIHKLHAIKDFNRTAMLLLLVQLTSAAVDNLLDVRFPFVLKSP